MPAWCSNFFLSGGNPRPTRSVKHAKDDALGKFKQNDVQGMSSMAHARVLDALQAVAFGEGRNCLRQ